MQATFPSAIPPYPVRVEGHLETPSRWRWLVKWLLALPHYVVLAVLWLGFVSSAVVAFVAVLFTGRYPRPLFDFNLGVLRWSWRVAFYAYGANGTDRYPPFTLGEVDDYPARLDVAYPEPRRRGFALIGWWMAGIPQYMIAGLFIGGGGAVGWTVATHSWGGVTWIGLIGLLVLVGAVILLVRGEYPRPVFDLVLGLNRWALRVVAYAAVMTPEYPPFRLDIGEDDPAGVFTVARTAEDAAPARSAPGRVAIAVVASITCLAAVAAIAAGGAAVVLDRTQRDADGYQMTSSEAYSTTSYALVSAGYRAGAADDWFVSRDLLGTVRIRTHSRRPLFVAVASERAVRRYLAGVAHARGTRFDQRSADFREVRGGAPRTLPATSRIWAASVTGAGDQTLSWKPGSGSWRIVVMNADASPGVAADVAVGARLPHLLTLGIAVLGGGILLLLLGGGALALALHRRR